MRKRLLVLLMTVMMVVMSAAPAMAVKGIKDPQPVEPPGRTENNGNGGTNEQAADPQTGRFNKFDHGSPQNGK